MSSQRNNQTERYTNELVDATECAEPNMIDRRMGSNPYVLNQSSQEKSVEMSMVSKDFVPR